MKLKKHFPTSLLLLTIISFSSCSTIPERATAVKPFSKEKYLGKWYEIARLDFKYEEGLNNTTAEYSINLDGSIKVFNKGFDIKKQEWTESTGKAKFVHDDQTAMLKVSFFGPFYSGYNVIAIDKDYKYALVAGESLKYMWILSREVTIPNEIKEKYLKKAKDIGYDITELIWVEHNLK